MTHGSSAARSTTPFPTALETQTPKPHAPTKLNKAAQTTAVFRDSLQLDKTATTEFAAS